VNWPKKSATARFARRLFGYQVHEFNFAHKQLEAGVACNGVVVGNLFLDQDGYGYDCGFRCSDCQSSFTIERDFNDFYNPAKIAHTTIQPESGFGKGPNGGHFVTYLPE